MSEKEFRYDTREYSYITPADCEEAMKGTQGNITAEQAAEAFEVFQARKDFYNAAEAFEEFSNAEEHRRERLKRAGLAGDEISSEEARDQFISKITKR